MQWVACSLSRARLTNCCGTLVAWPWTSRTHSLGSDFEDVSKSFLSWTAHLPTVTRKSSVLFSRRFLFWEVTSCYFSLPIVCRISLLSQNCFQNLSFQVNKRELSLPTVDHILSLILLPRFFKTLWAMNYSWDCLSSLPHIESMCLWGHLPS